MRPARRKIEKAWVHPAAVVAETARIGAGTRIWAFAQIGDRARVGRNCVIGHGAYVDRFVQVGDRVKIHNHAMLYHGLVVEDDVFIGPGACFTNDPHPRSGRTRNLSGIRWRVRRGASIGAGAIIVPDVSIGRYALVGAGAVVTRPVPAFGLVLGHPARLAGFVCYCGRPLPARQRRCRRCGRRVPVPARFTASA